MVEIHFSGGIIHGLLTKVTQGEALEFAVAASALNIPSMEISIWYLLKKLKLWLVVMQADVYKDNAKDRLLYFKIKIIEMSRFDKVAVFNKIASTRMVPVFYHKDVEIVKKVVKSCYDGGVRVFEFTNRGDFAHEVF